MSSFPKSIPFVQHPDKLITKIQQNTQKAVNTAINSPFGSGNLRLNVPFPFDAALSPPSYVHSTITPGCVLIDHGLGRAPIGWVICGLVWTNGNAGSLSSTLGIVQPNNTVPLCGFAIDPTKQLCLFNRLGAAVSFTVNVWVF